MRAQLPDMPPIPCIECGADVMVLFTRRTRLVYRCRSYPACEGRLPANPDGTPRGRPRKVALQRARAGMHREIRRLAPMPVGMIYEWLAAQMMIPPSECHGRRFGQDRAEQAFALLGDVTREGIEAWFDAGKPAPEHIPEIRWSRDRAL